MSSIANSKFSKSSLFIWWVTFLDHFSISVFFGTVIPLFLAKNSIFIFSIDKNIVFGLFLLIYPIFQSTASLIWGYLADRWGRRPVLLMTILGSLLGYWLMSLGIYLKSFDLLVIGRIVSAIMAVNTAIVQASVADMSKGIKKAKRFNSQFIAVSLGFIIGPYFIDFSTHQTHFAFAYLGLSLGYVIAWLLLLATFSETLVISTANLSLRFRCSTIFAELRNIHIKKILIIWILFQLGWALFFQYSGDYLYQSKHISNEMINHIFSWLSLGALGAQAIIVPFVLSRWSLIRLATIGIFAIGSSLIILSFFNLGIMFAIFISIYCLGIALFLTTIYSYISNLVDDQSQGRIMTLLASVQGAMTIVAAGLGSILMRYYLATPYVVGGAIILVAGFALLMITKNSHKNSA